MTEPLSIKDLNCSTCTNKDPYGYCPIDGWKVIGNHCTTVQESFTGMCGCASHPLALQVLAKPIIDELECELKDQRVLEETHYRKEHAAIHKAIGDTVEYAIGLLKGDAL